MRRCSLDGKRSCDNSCIAYDALAGGCRLKTTSFRSVSGKDNEDDLKII